MDFASYITGFVDGEGCFSVSFSKCNKLNTGIEVRPSFSISQNLKSKSVLLSIQKYFNCGFIRFSKNDRIYKYEVRSINDLVRKIIPHFEKYPLMTFKQNDFSSFKEICLLVFQNKHKNASNLISIIERAYQMNGAGKRKYEKAKLLRMLMR